MFSLVIDIKFVMFKLSVLVGVWDVFCDFKWNNDGYLELVEDLGCEFGWIVVGGERWCVICFGLFGWWSMVY